MARSVSNVQITTDSFYGLINKTNVLLHGMTVEFVTTSNNIVGANTSGNSNILGVLSAPVIGTSTLKGSNGTSANSTTTLNVGISNSTTSSNVVISGYVANLVANTIHLLSNTVIQASNAFVNTSSLRVISNTTLSGNSTTNNFILTGNSTSTELTINGNAAYVSVLNFIVNSVSTVTGNSTLKANTTTTNISVFGNTTTSNVTLSGNLVTVSSNLFITGNVVNVVGNLAVDTSTLFVDSVNNRVGILTNVPQYALHVVGANNDSVVVIENSLHNTTLDVSTNSSSVVVKAGTGDSLIFNSNNGSGDGWIMIAANGNIGLANSVPDALITIGSGTKVFTNGTIQTSGDLICTGDLYANIVFMGGSNQATVTATVCPIVPPNTSYSSLNLEASTIQGPNPFNTFTNTTPQRIDVIKQTEYQATKYTLQIQDVDLPSEVFMTEVSVIYGYGNAHATTYGTIFTNTAFVDVTVDANSTFYTLMAAPTAAYLASRGGTVNLQFRGVRQKCR